MRDPQALQCVERVVNGEKEAKVVIRTSLPVRTTLKIAAVRPEGLEELEIGAVVTVTDVSHIFEAEKMRSDFVANVSHELRSPLTSLSGIIETLKEAAKDDKAARQHFLKIMEREASRMNRLIGDLLSLSKVEVNAHVRPDGLVDLPKLIEQVIATFVSRHETERPDIRFETPGPMAPIPGDEDELTQVFHNLIENAIKYGTAETPVKITLAVLPQAPGIRGGALSVAVSDQGSGIAPRHIPRLTERFYRVDEGRSRDKGGTGLGLAIVKHIVNRHLGRLHIESEVGVGSTFTVYLPTS